MNRLKRKCPYFIGMIVSLICVLCMFFPFFAIKGTEYYYNLFIMLSLSELGFWHILLCIFIVLFCLTIIFTFVICLLEILKDAKLIEFKITIGKITSYLILKFSLITLLVISAVMTLLTWFMILANSDFGLIFGAGPFIILVILLFSVVLFMFLERADYFKNWEEINDTKIKDKNEEQVVTEETPVKEEKAEEEIVIDPEKLDK